MEVIITGIVLYAIYYAVAQSRKKKKQAVHNRQTTYQPVHVDRKTFTREYILNRGCAELEIPENKRKTVLTMLANGISQGDVKATARTLRDSLGDDLRCPQAEAHLSQLVTPSGKPARVTPTKIADSFVRHLNLEVMNQCELVSWRLGGGVVSAVQVSGGHDGCKETNTKYTFEQLENDQSLIPPYTWGCTCMVVPVTDI